MIYQALEAAKARRVALVGIAKHAGKTTAMNRLIELATEQGRALGIVSIGVDGERNDAILGVPKPEVFAPVGALVASAGDVLTTGTAGLRILEATGITSTLGAVYLARVEQAGTVLLAGIRSLAQVEQVLQRMEAHGAELCFVDGAFDRMMAASPWLTDGVVLATGAVAGKSLSEVVEKSGYFLQRFALPTATEAEAQLFDLAWEHGALVVGVEQFVDDEVGQAVGMGNAGNNVIPTLPNLFHPVLLSQSSSFVANPQSDPQWPGAERAKVLAVTGAVTDRLLAMLEGLPRGFTLVLPDATHFFGTQAAWRKFLRRGHRIVVRRAIQVLGLTVNPHSVAGYDLPRSELLEAMRSLARNLPVEDVKR